MLKMPQQNSQATVGNPIVRKSLRRASLRLSVFKSSLVSALCLIGSCAVAQVNVVTAHNDIARTGQNLSETILTPANVNSSQFGKLFSVPVNGVISTQPLYVSQVAIPGNATHNVVYAVTSGDYVYAYDADTNGGTAAQPLWQDALVSNSTPAGTLQDRFGVTGTPAIDLSTNTMYVVSSETQGSADIFRLHALDITSGAEKMGGPVTIQGSMPGTGSGSVGGVLTFDATYQLQRPGLLLLNGVLYIAIGSIADEGPYHGWLFSYNPATLKQIDLYCTAPNGSGDGIWMAGAGLAAEVNDASKPYGRMFIATANGAYSASSPYSNNMSLGMSVIDLDLTDGKMTVADEFTPANEALLDTQDGDVGSGGVVLLPTQTLGSGGTLEPLVQVGKSGAFYILDRNNLGGYNAGGDQIVQELQTPQSGTQNWGAGVWGSVAYWNGIIYSGGTNPGESNSLTAYSFLSGKLSTTPTSQSAEKFGMPSPTPSISSNGTQNGVVWVLNTNGVYSSEPEALAAFNATNLGQQLYSTSSNPDRDSPGAAVKYTVPTVANGKVYVGGFYQLSVYGLLGATPTAALPVFNPPSGTFTGSQSVTIADSTPHASIFYTTDGSAPTTSSKWYTGPINVTSSETITAMASATGYLQGAPVSANYSSTADVANPVFSLAAGSYNGTQTLTITDSSSNAQIYYTVDGSTPTTSSRRYSGPIAVPISETVQAFATNPSLLASSVVSASYVVNPAYDIDFSQGFADAEGPMTFNGSTDLDDLRLQLTNGGLFEAGSAFYATPVNIQSFTTDFTFQISNPVADGITFTIQNEGPTAIGAYGAGLGYAGIQKSIAIKFDIHNNAGEGTDSTGLYVDGLLPTVPAIDLSQTGIALTSGDEFDAHITYDGTNLTMTLTDTVSSVAWSHSWPINIPSVMVGNTAYVGFTGGTGTGSSSQKFTYWTYVSGPPVAPNFPAGFDAANLALNGAAINGTSLQLTNGGKMQATSAYYSMPVDIESFSSTFDFQLTDAVADGFTFVLQNDGAASVGAAGAGLGYAGIGNSVAIKFDIHNNSGEGNDSTGVYVNGAVPTVPATDLTSSGVQLANGDQIQVNVTYDGTTLSWSLLDLDVFFPSHLFWSGSKAIKIPQVIGSNTAYVGFTGGTGGSTAIQDILNWTFTNQ